MSEIEDLEYICKILDEKRIDVKWLFKKQYSSIKQALEELDKFKALLKKYEIKDIKALEELIKDYDDMAKALIQYTLGIEIEVKS